MLELTSNEEIIAFIKYEWVFIRVFRIFLFYLVLLTIIGSKKVSKIWFSKQNFTLNPYTRQQSTKKTKTYRFRAGEWILILQIAFDSGESQESLWVNVMYDKWKLHFSIRKCISKVHLVATKNKKCVTRKIFMKMS